MPLTHARKELTIHEASTTDAWEERMRHEPDGVIRQINGKCSLWNLTKISWYTNSYYKQHSLLLDLFKFTDMENWASFKCTTLQRKQPDSLLKSYGLCRMNQDELPGSQVLMTRGWVRIARSWTGMPGSAMKRSKIMLRIKNIEIIHMIQLTKNYFCNWINRNMVHRLRCHLQFCAPSRTPLPMASSITSDSLRVRKEIINDQKSSFAWLVRNTLSQLVWLMSQVVLTLILRSDVIFTPIYDNLSMLIIYIQKYSAW